MNNDNEEGCSYNTLIFVLILISLAVMCTRLGTLEQKLEHHVQHTMDYKR